jgi:hypothetical protein
MKVDCERGSFVRFQALTEASMNVAVFRDVAPCNLVDVDRCFKGAYCVHHQGDEPTSLQTPSVANTMSYKQGRSFAERINSCLVLLIYGSCSSIRCLLKGNFARLQYKIQRLPCCCVENPVNKDYLHMSGSVNTFVLEVSIQRVYFFPWIGCV